jgi:hypothetical protein
MSHLKRLAGIRSQGMQANDTDDIPQLVEDFEKEINVDDAIQSKIDADDAPTETVD